MPCHDMQCNTSPFCCSLTVLLYFNNNSPKQIRKLFQKLSKIRGAGKKTCCSSWAYPA